MKKLLGHSNCDKTGCTVCKGHKNITTFLRLLFPSSNNNPHIDGFYKCSVCGTLLAVPTHYYSLLPKLLYLILSTLTSVCLISVILCTGIYALLGRLFSTFVFTMGIIGCSAVINRIISATAMYYGKWRAIDTIYEDELVSYCKEEEKFKREREMKQLLTVVAIGLGVCFLAKNFALTVWVLFVITIGFFLRFCVLKRKR